MTEVIKKNHKINLFLLLHFLMAHCDYKPRQIRLQGSAQLGFPAFDVEEILLDGNRQAVITLNLLSLTSIDTCLPLYFSDIFRSEEGGTLKKFIDVITQPLFIQFYYLWCRSHPIVDFNRGNNFYCECLEAFLSSKTRHLPDSKYALFGVFFSRTQTKREIKALVQMVTGSQVVDVNEFCLSWISVPCQSSCIKNNGLSDTAILGDRCLDAASFVIIHIMTKCLAKAVDLLPCHHKGAELQTALKIFLGPCIQYKIIISLKYQQQGQLVLGKNEIILGQFAVIGLSSQLGNAYCYLSKRS